MSAIGTLRCNSLTIHEDAPATRRIRDCDRRADLLALLSGCLVECRSCWINSNRAIAEYGNEWNLCIILVCRTPHAEIAHGLTRRDVEERCIDAAYNILVVSLLVQMRLIRKGRHLPAIFSRIDIAVACGKLRIAIRGVDLHHIGNSLRGACSIIGNNRPLGYIWRNGICLCRSNRVIRSVNS